MRIPEKNGLENDDERYLYSHDADICGSFADSERIGTIIRLVKGYSFGRKILDVGCAQGNVSTLLAEEGFEATALDMNRNFLNYAKKKREFGKIAYVRANAMHLPFKADTFDAVILGEIMEHVAYPERLIEAAKKVLKKEGILIITTPNDHLLLGLLSGNKPEPFDFNLDQRKKLVKKQFGPAGEDHLFVFDMGSLQKLVSEKNLSIIEKGHNNSGLINKLTFPLIFFLRKSFLQATDRLFVKLPFFKDRFSLGLYIACRKQDG